PRQHLEVNQEEHEEGPSGDSLERRAGDARRESGQQRSSEDRGKSDERGERASQEDRARRDRKGGQPRGIVEVVEAPGVQPEEIEGGERQVDHFPRRRQVLALEQQPQQLAGEEEEQAGKRDREDRRHRSADPPRAAARSPEVFPPEVGEEAEVARHGAAGGGVPTQSRSPPWGTLRPTSLTNVSSSAASGPSPAWTPSSDTVPRPRRRPSWMIAMRVQSFSTTSSTCDV